MRPGRKTRCRAGCSEVTASLRPWIESMLSRSCASRTFPTLAEAALRYTLSSPHVSTVIPGMLTPEEIDMNVAYADGQPFPVELLDRLREHSWPRNFYK